MLTGVGGVGLTQGGIYFMKAVREDSGPAGETPALHKNYVRVLSPRDGDFEGFEFGFEFHRL